MIFVNTIFSFLLLFAVEAHNDTLHRFDDPDLYQLGLEEMEAGNFERTAELWIEHALNADSPEYAIGYELIKHVTQHKLR